MEDTRLRQLESRYKLRVKTGCETCRIRRVKCDETKPACLRCTKTGRKCEGYERLEKPKKGTSAAAAAAASYRNSSFLVLPQRSHQRQSSTPKGSRTPSPPAGPSRKTPSPISLSPSSIISSDTLELRSFAYFQARTIPNWTEFFDSTLWSRTMLQLSHREPAIKHGILALSVLHERYERSSPIFSNDCNDFAFLQYVQAVKHSNHLLEKHGSGEENLEAVLIVCILFTCYENLAGNYVAANMHLRNGMRILEGQRRLRLARGKGKSAIAWESGMDSDLSEIEMVLNRFDLQHMTFSDNASRYDYVIDLAPQCPVIPEMFTSNGQARDSLVDLLRCMMWVGGTLDQYPDVITHPTWQRLSGEIVVAFGSWEHRFAEYQHSMPLEKLRDPKVYAGNTLLIISSLVLRVFVGSGAGYMNEGTWDNFMEEFKTIIDLAETLPIWKIGRLQDRTSPPRGSCSRSPTPAVPAITTPPAPRSSPILNNKPIAPHPYTAESFPSPGQTTFIFKQEPPFRPPLPASERGYFKQEFSPPPPTVPIPPSQEQIPTFFSPSFELSPIVPLFVASCRCRDPVLRRRALSLLLRSRRREGPWDSYAAGMVALRCMWKEEGIEGVVTGDVDEMLAFNPAVRSAADVPDEKRVQDIFVRVKVDEGKVETVYSFTTGVEEGEIVAYESRGDDGGKPPGAQ